MSEWLIDFEKRVIKEKDKEIALYSEEGFAKLSSLWLKVGWQLHYHYTFTWLGIPTLQLPEDLIRLQEVIVDLKPDWIIECGVAMGGTTLFLASLCHLQAHGKVIGVEKDLHIHNKKRLEESPLFSYIDLVIGDSTSDETLRMIRNKIQSKESVLVLLDSNHSYEHVAKELAIYAPFVSAGSYIIVADTLKQNLHDVPRGKAEWKEDNPSNAIAKFLQNHPEFERVYPTKKYDRGKMKYTASHFEGGWLRRKIK